MRDRIVLAILLFHLKKEVAAVIEQDFVISFGDRFTVFIQFRLDITIFRTNDIQSPVDMLQLKIRRFKELAGFFKCVQFGRRIQYSAVNEPGKGTVQVISKFVFTGNIRTDFRKAQAMV